MLLKLCLEVGEFRDSVSALPLPHSENFRRKLWNRRPYLLEQLDVIVPLLATPAIHLLPTLCLDPTPFGLDLHPAELIASAHHLLAPVVVDNHLDATEKTAFA